MQLTVKRKIRFLYSACLLVIFEQVTKAEVEDRRRTIAYLDDCAKSMTDAEAGEPVKPSTAALAERFSHVTQQYLALANDVDGRVEELAVNLPAWEDFNSGVTSLNCWLDGQTARLAETKLVAPDEADDIWKVCVFWLFIEMCLERWKRRYVFFSFTNGEQLEVW
jgi:hypothetical protein